MKKNLKVAIYYDNRFGRNDGPPLYYLNCLQKHFKNVSVHHLIPGEPGVDKDGPYDLHFWVDWGEDSLPLDLEKMKIPDDGGKKIYVVSDAHLDDGYRFKKATEFDYVFFNQKHYIKQYLNNELKGQDFENAASEFLKKMANGNVQEVFYLPHAGEPEAYPHFDIIKKYDVCFIGHIQENHKDNGIEMSRVDVLDALFKEISNFYFGTRMPAFPDKNMFEDAAKKFCQSKVVFNISIGNDANMRFFETLVTGSFLLTNNIPELKNLEKYGFKEGVHYIGYDTLDDAITKAKYYIEHDEGREKIAEAGYKQALKTGTYEARIKEILERIGD